MRAQRALGLELTRDPQAQADARAVRARHRAQAPLPPLPQSRESTFYFTVLPVKFRLRVSLLSLLNDV